eukprot:TRINITY_DN3197_c0_g1_i3.p1 TRINITY_DN3197_c0_g1~~TRINITY_DN3197_c0_g1_i3.p1  ORF type:complete len:124 (-),score=64.37 TRINITY_DN3197_c0_g1_i3:9-380(-)
MIRRPPRSTQSRSSAASDVYKRQAKDHYQWGNVSEYLRVVKAEVCADLKASTALELATMKEEMVRYGCRMLRQVTVKTKAVSYTHLRAHETVLDLVCRLLLEKKKTHNKTTSTQSYKLTYRHK